MKKIIVVLALISSSMGLGISIRNDTGKDSQISFKYEGKKYTTGYPVKKSSTAIITTDTDGGHNYIRVKYITPERENRDESYRINNIGKTIFYEIDAIPAGSIIVHNITPEPIEAFYGESAKKRIESHQKIAFILRQSKSRQRLFRGQT